MSLEVDFPTMLINNEAVNDLINGRFYPLRMPQNTPLPAGTFQLISDAGELLHGGEAGKLKRARIQVTWSATQYADVKAVANAAERALDGAAAFGCIRSIWKESEQDNFGTQSKVYIVRQDFMMWHDVSD